MKTTLISFWQARNEREKNLLIFCAAFLLAVFLYAYVWLPGEKIRARLRETLPQLRAEAARMTEQAVEIKRLRKTLPAPGQPQDIKQAIDASAQRHQLHDRVSTLNTDATGKAVLTLNAVAFDAWIRWLDALQNENHLRLVSCRIQVLGEPGMVKVDATLTGTGA